MKKHILSIFKNYYTSYTFWIFFFAILLRVLLALINREANDNHVEVIRRMLLGLSLEKEACGECFQPKLYYYIIAQIVHFSPLRITITSMRITVIAQFLNVFAGIGTLTILWLFIRAQPVNKILKHLTFALFALNPDFLGINGQATNDSFVIFFSTGALYALWQYLGSGQFYYKILLIISVVLAALSKGSGILLFVAVSVCLLIRAVSVYKQKMRFIHYMMTVLLFILFFIVGMLLFSPYFHYYQLYGSPFISSWVKSPPPDFFIDTYIKRPGITSIVRGYLSFDFFDLIKTPYISNDANIFPLHRTSLWSQLYGRAYSIQFAQWPPSWQDTSAYVIELTRVIFVLALLPTLIGILGYVLEIKKGILLALRTFSSYFSEKRGWIFSCVFFFFIIFIVDYTYIYRDFSFMKTIFIYPGILCLVQFFIKGGSYLLEKLREHKYALQFFLSILVIFILLEVNDVVLLLYHLASL